MKLLVITILSAVLIPLVHFLLAHVYKLQYSRAIAMLGAFAVYFIVCLSGAFYFGKPGFLCYMAVCSTAGFFCLGYMEAFSMICRGFSLHIMVDVYESKSLDIEGIKMKYGAGKGIDWLFNKRIANMRELGLVDVGGGILKIRPLGALVGRAGLLMKNGLKMGAGG